MIEGVEAFTRDGTFLALAGILGGAIAGIFLMFYRDIVSAEHYKTTFWLRDGRLVWLSDKHAIDKSLDYKVGRAFENRLEYKATGGVDPDLLLEALYKLQRIASLKAATFSLGVIALSSTLILLSFGGLSSTHGGWIVVGVVAGACFEHSVWLFAQSNYPTPVMSSEKSAFRAGLEAEVGLLTEVVQAIDVSMMRLLRWLLSIFTTRHTER